MSSFTLLLIMYGLMTLGSASILYFSFREKVDTSGRYFLLAESLMLLVILLAIATNIYPQYANPLALFSGNLIHMASDAAILFSIISLTRNVPAIKYLGVLLFAAIFAALIEIGRLWDPSLSIAIFSATSGGFALATYFACKSSPDVGLKDNLFLRWIQYIEIGLLIFSIFRIASCFSDSPISPVQPPTLATLAFTVLVVLNIFRYISYQSLRISWYDPNSSSENSLNRTLTKLVKEKNQFLQGLISSNRAIGISALANSLAHQLSQPITGIIFQSESVKRDLVDLGGHQRLVGTLDTVTNQLEKLSDLVNSLRRIFSQQLPDMLPVNLREACDEILEIIEPTFHSKKISFTKLYKSNPMVRGDTVQLQQVLINLFNNAIDAIVSSDAQSREISLTISQEGSYALVIIQDSGNGISPELSARMFELYQTTKKDGMGIGLWLSKEIIDRHEGIINASNSLQGGAVFKIRLPLSKESSGVA